MESYDTLSEAIAALRQEGYTEDFNLRQNCIECRNGQFQFQPSDFHIDSVFRFEGPTDPADEAILYAISSDTEDIKGLLVNGYGISDASLTSEMLEKLR